MVEKVFESVAVKQLDVGTEQLQAGKTGRPAYFHAETNVKLGGYFNAAKAQMHYGAAGTGEITGFGSAFNSEMYLPNKTMTGGSYTSLEVNLNFQANTVDHGNANYPISMAHFKVGGTQAKIDTWEDSAAGCLFSIQGLTVGNGSIFSNETPTAANMTHALKIMIGATPYYIVLSTTST